jgi:ABC-2 type transport system permease protein
VLAAATIAGLQLRRRLRDRSAILQGILAPILLAVIIAAAFGGGGSIDASIGVADRDGGALGAALVGAGVLPDDGQGDGDSDGEGGATVELVALTDPGGAEEAVASGEVDAAIVIPEGFRASLAGEPLPIEVLADAGKEIPGEVAAAVAARLAAQVDASRAMVGTALAADPSLATDPGPEALATEAATVPPTLTLGPSAFGDGFDPIAYFAPSMAILFGFLTLGTGARTILVERRTGTLARVRAAPVSDRAVLAGVTASVVAVGLVSFLVIWLVTSVAFGASWGDPAAVAAVIAATVLAIAGISTLVTGLARTEAQADGISSVVAFGFALLGGGFLTPGDLPGALERIALLTPNRWALDAFAELAAGGGDLGSVAVPLLVLTSIGLVTGAIGLRSVRLGPA